MGMSPAPTIVNLYFAIYKATHILPLLNSFLFYLKRFINDGLGIWLHNPDLFMDMTIKISGNRLITALYAKAVALYQYIPPTSCHPPGALTGLVFGQVLQIFQICSRDQDIDLELAAFYHHLLDPGYKAANIIPLLIKGIDNANYYLSLTEAQREKVKKALMSRADE